MTEPPSTVLLVEDDDATRTFLADNLTADGYELLVAETIREATRLLETRFPDVAVVDVGLPDGSGLDLVRHVREADGLASRIDPFTPMLVLSGRAGDVDRIRGFERGADDYVPKPFAYPELRLRLAALLRRAHGRRGRGGLRGGALEGDPTARGGRLHGEGNALSQEEVAALLAPAAGAPPRVSQE